MSRDREREQWEEFRANAAEMLLDTGYLALATACIAGLRFEIGHLLPPHFEIIPSLFTLDDTFNAGHAITIGRWMLNTTIRLMRVRIPAMRGKRDD
jgi:hypothetical protein